MSRVPYHPFPQTHWSLVCRAGSDDAAARREALGILLERYRPALFSYLIECWKMCEEEAEEVLQAFVVDRILEHDLVGGADRRKGRFRTLLITSLHNFAVSRFRKERVRASLELKPGLLPDPGATAGAAFEADWARELLKNVLRAMEDECIRTGRLDVWTIFRERVLAEVFDDAVPTEYQALAVQLGLQSPMQAANLLVTAKRTFARLLRTAVAEYETDENDIEQEIADLHRILSAASQCHAKQPPRRHHP